MILKKVLNNNLLYFTVKRIIEVLPPSFKKKGVLVMVLLFFNSILELIGLAVIIPIVTIILQEDAIQNNQLLSWVYNFFGFSSTKAFATVLALSAFAIIISKNIIGLWITKVQAKFSYNLFQHLSLKLFRYYYNLGFLYFKGTNANKIFRNINGIPLEFANQVVINTITMLNEGIVLLFIVVSILLYDPLIVLLLVLTVLPVFVFFYQGVKNRIHSVQSNLNIVTVDISKSLYQAIYGFVDVEITNSEGHFFSEQKILLNRAIKERTKNQVYQHAPTKVIETAMMASVIIIALYGLFFLENRGHLVGLISVFALAAYRILPSINRMMIAILGIKGFQYTFDVVGQVKNYHPDKKPSYNASLKQLIFHGQIEIKDLGFQYPKSNNKVLDQINFTVEKGESIGIIGRSGAGKSTFINILLGFLSPTEGEMLVDGIEITQENLYSWREIIGYVQQDVFILDASVAENIAFGVPKNEIDYPKLNLVLKQAMLDDFVDNLPNGTDTIIGERGSLISGGQKQRLGIARALYKDIEILILDEATSALDNETEKELTGAIENIAKSGLTTIVIAHRLTTLRNCKHIYELSEGQLGKCWNYDELIKAKIANVE